MTATLLGILLCVVVSFIWFSIHAWTSNFPNNPPSSPTEAWWRRLWERMPARFMGIFSLILGGLLLVAMVFEAFQAKS